MKKMICFALVFLTSCTPKPASPPFVYNQECPLVCWLGIKPGVTTAEEARSLLNSSDQIKKSSYIEHETGFSVDWYSGQESQPTNVVFVLENNVVEKINFNFANTAKIQDYANLFGSPDEISIKQSDLADAVHTEYVVYYTSLKVLIFVLVAADHGPDPSDYIYVLSMNVASDDPNVPKWALEHNEFRQPWLGFGHLEEYLKNRPWPLE